MARWRLAQVPSTGALESPDIKHTYMVAEVGAPTPTVIKLLVGVRTAAMALPAVTRINPDHIIQASGTFWKP